MNNQRANFCIKSTEEQRGVQELSLAGGSTGRDLDGASAKKNLRKGSRDRRAALHFTARARTRANELNHRATPGDARNDSSVGSVCRVWLWRESPREVRLSPRCFSRFFFTGSSLQNIVRGSTPGARLLTSEKRVIVTSPYTVSCRVAARSARVQFGHSQRSSRYDPSQCFLERRSSEGVRLGQPFEQSDSQKFASMTNVSGNTTARPMHPRPSRLRKVPEGPRDAGHAAAVLAVGGRQDAAGLEFEG